MEILIDVNGSDNGIKPAILGSIKALGNTESKLTLVGDEDKIIEVIKEEYKEEKAKEIISKINIMDAKDVITNNDEPAFAIKNKKESIVILILYF